MAEPIRKIASPLHRRPQGARPHPRPRPLSWVPDETGPEPILRRARTAAPRPAPQPAPALPEESALPPTEAEAVRYRSRTVQPVSRKKLRAALQAALGLHLAAVALLILFPSATQPAGLSETLLATAVLLAGGTVLAFAVVGRRV